MLDSQQQHFGGSADVTLNTHKLTTYGGRVVRVRDNPPFSAARTLFLPAGNTFTEGGPIFVISNGSSDISTVKSSNNATIGTVGAGSTGYIFLLDAGANGGAGRWAVAGNGTSGEVGDQGSPAGFNFGNALTLSGLGTGLGTAEDLPEFEDQRELNFGNSFVAIPITPSI